jgi:hypothetical protein
MDLHVPDLHAPLPDFARLDAGEQLTLARWIRGEARPQLMLHLGKLLAVQDSSTGAVLDRMEADLRLQQLNLYAAELDLAIAHHGAPVPSERMPVRFHELELVPGVSVSARTELFFSPTTKSVVHGPDALRFALTLAEQLLEPGEEVEELETAHWRRVMLSNLRLEVRVRGEGDAAPAAGSDPESCVLGTVRTSAGRRLDYRGKLLPGHPIFEESGHNACAMEMLRPLDWTRVDGRDAIRLKLAPEEPAFAQLNASRAFGMFMLVELLGLLTGLKSPGTTATHLSVKIQGLSVPERLGDLFRAGVTLEYEKLFDGAVERMAQTRTVPFRYRFSPFQRSLASGRMAITELSIPELMALSQ